jgi:hypothetical protein
MRDPVPFALVQLKPLQISRSAVTVALSVVDSADQRVSFEKDTHVGGTVIEPGGSSKGNADCGVEKKVTTTDSSSGSVERTFNYHKSTVDAFMGVAFWSALQWNERETDDFWIPAVKSVGQRPKDKKALKLAARPPLLYTPPSTPQPTAQSPPTSGSVNAAYLKNESKSYLGPNLRATPRPPGAIMEEDARADLGLAVRRREHLVIEERVEGGRGLYIVREWDLNVYLGKYISSGEEGEQEREKKTMLSVNSPVVSMTRVPKMAASFAPPRMAMSWQ